MASDADLPDLIPAPEPDRDLPPPSGKWGFGGGLVFSVLLHVLVTVLLIANLEWPFEETAPQPPIEVVILPQPEPQEEAQAPEAEPVETPETPEPAETEEAEEQPEPAPPPPPPPAPEDPAPEDPEPEQQESPAAPAILQPVVRFGEEDQAQAAEEDGSAPEPDEAADVSDPEADAETSETTDAEDPAEQPGDDGEAEETVEGGETPEEPTEDPTEEPAEEATEEPAAELEPETEPEPAPAPEPEPETAEPVEGPETVDPEEASEDPAETPEVTEEGNPEAPGIADTGVEPEDFGTVGRIVTDARPVSKPAAPPRTPARQTAQNQAQSRSGASGRPPLARARELFSSSILSDVRTQTAMRNMGPAERLNLLCMTELRAQLQDFDPSRPPEMLPSFRPRPGTILEPGAAAYQSRGQWYDLAFRCETDPDVREVSAFSFRIGPPIPRSEWGARGLPSF